MKTAWFTFGQDHRHTLRDNQLLDKDVVIEITAEEPRDVMFGLFGRKWSMHYDEKPNMSHFPRGILRLTFLAVGSS